MSIAMLSDAFNKNILYSDILENQILRSLMDNQEIYGQVEGDLSEDLFYYAQNKIICRAVMDLSKSGKSCDSVMVMDWLRSHNLEKDSGGEKYILNIMTVPLIADDIRDHINRLEQYAIRRSIETALEMALKAIRVDRAIDTSELAETCSKAIMEASSGVFGADTFSNPTECVISTIERIVCGDLHGVPTGFLGLDAQIGGIQKGDLVIIAGGSSSGKSILASNISVNLMDETKQAVLFYSMEMTKQQVTQRILSAQSSVEINKLRMGTYKPDEWARFQHIADIWKTRPFYIDAKGGQTVESVASKTRRKFRELGGLSCIVVDYIQLMRAEKSVGRTQDIDHITRSLKTLALELDVPVIALSQYKRTGTAKPTVSDLRESGSIEQDANIIIMINHEDAYSELIVGKQREGERNISSRIVLNGAMGRFENPTSTWG